VNIYLICPVRNSELRFDIYVASLEWEGHKVHYPHRDAPQDDPTGAEICAVHLAAMKAADAVHVMWDINSKGSHFDLGMAYALDKPIRYAKEIYPDGNTKSYWKAIIAPQISAT
jgi:nucleoside 2-deoxyribosyltransferase